MTASARTALPARRPAPTRRILFAEARRWPFALLGAFLTALLFWPAYEGDTLWLGAGVALIFLIGWHALVVGRRLPWIPGLALGTAALQWVIAPWAAYHIGPYYKAFDMVVPPGQYFAYAVPALAALAGGMLIVLLRPGRRAPPLAQMAGPISRRFRVTCDLMVIVGLATHLILVPLLGGGSLALASALVGNLAFVGSLALLIARSPGWQLRVLATLGVQALVSAASGMFHDLVLWTAYFLLTLIYVRRLRIGTIILLAVSGIGVIMVLNVAKQQFRQTLQTSQAGLFGSATLLGSTMLENADAELAYGGTGLKANVTRLNQGWIIARTLYWVPNREPFANGETINASIRATVLPRFLDPNKLQMGGRTYFERFTGMPLLRTSMDLSVAGEMYVNYGYGGGLLGIFVFGALVGLAYRVFVRLSRRSPLWWAWAPFVLLYSTRAENSVAEVTNLQAKSAIVMLAVISAVPAWAALRRPLTQRLARVLGRPAAVPPPRPPIAPGAPHPTGPAV